MKILVTGASGFIGSHIAQCLKEKGHTVIGCGRTAINQKDMRYVRFDLMQTLPDLDADIIIHAAGLNPSANKTFNDYFDNNITITKNIVEYAKSYHVKRIIYIGTLSSYGFVEQVLKEESAHNNPDDYGLTKYVAEQLIKNSGIPYYILLPATVVGRRCGNNWIMKTVEALYNNQDVTYYNGKECFNNIVEVEDMCAFVVKLLEQEMEVSKTYLLASNEMTTIENIVVYLKKQLSSVSQLYSNPISKNPFSIDISKALEDGFSPRPITEILDEVCREIRNKC